ncbi:MAG: LacI family DNA-binding transcriptional regulator, partial [Lentisphaeria bacterium]
MPNIETIAKEADVSIATVSRTLRNPDNLKTDKQRRIINIAKKFNYDFNKCKKRILSRKTKQIIFLSFSKTLSSETFHANSTYMPIINSINKVIGKEDYNLI